MGELVVKLFGNYQAEHGIAQEFEALVGRESKVRILVEVGAMDKGLLQKSPVPKGDTDNLLKDV